MLIAPIDHNKEPDPEKHISRINSPFWTLPSRVGSGTSQKFNPSHSSEGVILRVRDTRLMERRKLLSEPPEQERRQKNNRKHVEDPDNHHILVIALERKAGEPTPWKAGDHVSVVAKFPAATPKPQAQPDTPKSPLPTKDEGDYVLHLSKDRPTEP